MLRYNLSWRRYCNDLFLGGDKKAANEIAGMRPCLDQEGRGGEVLDWREEGRPSTGQEAREVQEVVDRGLRDEEGRSSDTHEECNNKTRIWHEIAWLGIDDSSPKRGRSAQKSAKIDQGGSRFPTTQDQPWEDQHQRAFMTSFTAFAASILLSDAGISVPMSLIA